MCMYMYVYMYIHTCTCNNSKKCRILAYIKTINTNIMMALPVYVSIEKVKQLRVSGTLFVVLQGLTGTAVDLYAVASQEHEEKGVTGAVGGILRQIPGTVVKPVILLSEATRHVLGGVKNQFVPDARREAKEKWKTVETSD